MICSLAYRLARHCNSGRVAGDENGRCLNALVWDTLIQPALLYFYSPSNDRAIAPTSEGDDAFIFTISNTNIIKFKGTALSRTVRQPSVTVVAQKITEAATATVSVLGVNTGLTAVVSVQVNKTEGATVSPDQPEILENVGIGTGGRGY